MLEKGNYEVYSEKSNDLTLFYVYTQVLSIIDSLTQN